MHYLTYTLSRSNERWPEVLPDVAGRGRTGRKQYHNLKRGMGGTDYYLLESGRLWRKREGDFSRNVEVSRGKCTEEETLTRRQPSHFEFGRSRPHLWSAGHRGWAGVANDRDGLQIYSVFRQHWQPRDSDAPCCKITLTQHTLRIELGPPSGPANSSGPVRWLYVKYAIILWSENVIDICIYSSINSSWPADHPLNHIPNMVLSQDNDELLPLNYTGHPAVFSRRYIRGPTGYTCPIGNTY